MIRTNVGQVAGDRAAMFRLDVTADAASYALTVTADRLDDLGCLIDAALDGETTDAEPDADEPSDPVIAVEPDDGDGRRFALSFTGRGVARFTLRRLELIEFRDQIRTALTPHEEYERNNDREES